MAVDRYTRIVLTIIALELGWLGVKNATPVSVSAQQSEPMPVVIRGVEGVKGKPLFIPVRIAEQTAPVRVTWDRPLPIDVPLPIRVETISSPVVIETGARPLLVRSVQADAAPRPGL